MKKVLSLIAACLLTTACSLEENPNDQITEADVYTDATSLYKNAVATLYSYIGGNTDGQGLQGTCRGVYDLQTFGSDEAMLPTRGGDWLDGYIWQQMYKHTWTDGHEIVKNSWIYLYKVITLCNRSLELLDKYQELLTDDEYQQHWAEVRALRAMYYWYLIDLFGRVPLITSSHIPMNDVEQVERAEVFNFCVQELEETLPYLAKANSVRPGDYYGRMTLPVAQFVLAKLMLNAEVYTGVARWQDVIKYCDDLEQFGFTLEPNYANNFLVHNENSKENIFVIPMDKDLYPNQQQNLYRSYHYRHAAAYGFTAENGSCATLRALEIFGYKTDDEDARFADNYYAGIVYDLNNNIVKDRSGEMLIYLPEFVKYDLSGSKYVETAGARMKKYAVDKNAPNDGKQMDNDIVLFRYADVLLMRAEAKLRSGQDGQADFDRVRSRSNMGQRPLTLDNLLDERLLELAWEGWRRQDLIRFDRYETLYVGDDQIDESDGHTKVYPIPADVMAVNPRLVQNKGY